LGGPANQVKGVYASTILKDYATFISPLNLVRRFGLGSFEGLDRFIIHELVSSLCRLYTSDLTDIRSYIPVKHAYDYVLWRRGPSQPGKEEMASRS